MKKIILQSISGLIILLAIGCKKFVEVPAPTNLTVSSAVFTSDSSANSAIAGIYSEMMNSQTQFCAGQATFYTGMSADELYYFTASSRDEFLKNEIGEVSHSTLTNIFWTPCYKYIYIANICIEKLNQSTGLSTQVKNRLLGEAKFIRAWCYFYLSNLFGDVPLILSPDYTVTAFLPRSPIADVQRQMVLDLIDARDLLPESYLTTERARPNKWAASALLARVYLYQKNWALAESEATTVLNSGIYLMNTSLATVFQKTSKETIWQLQPVNPLWNTWEGREILPASATEIPKYCLATNLVTGFASADQRKAAWVSSRTYMGQTVSYASKYKVYGNGAPITEYYVILRLAEQYLIRAEARNEQNNFTAALADINMIRSRAGLAALISTSQSEIAGWIERERKFELFAEWGHRWFDLKRTDRANAVLGPLKGLTWQATDQLYPIPLQQLNTNPNLIQNPGY